MLQHQSIAGQGPICTSCGQAATISLDYPSDKALWRTLQVVVCDHCGFGWVPRLTFDLDAYYARDYGRTHGRRHLTPEYFKTIDDDAGKKTNRARWHAELLKSRFGRLGRVLDIGSGPGFFLHYVDAAEKYAIESDPLSQPLLKWLGVTVVKSLDEAPQQDAIVASHVLEHIPVEGYKGFVDAALARLVPGGVLLMEVPQWGYLYKNPKQKDDTKHDPHTLFFSKAALLSAVDKAELVMFQDDKFIYEAPGGVIDEASKIPKQPRGSAMLGLWRKPL